MTKVHLWPDFRGADEGDGGVRRVVEGQKASLPGAGIELVDDADAADVIACHITAPPAYVKLYPRKPLVAHCHGLYWSEYEWHQWAIKANAEVMNLLRIADAITAPSEWVAQVIRRHTSRPVHVVPHGVDVAEWEPMEADRAYVLWNKTRPDPVCDPWPVVEAARRLPHILFVTTYLPDPAPDPPLSNIVETGRVPFDQAQRYVRGAKAYLATVKETFGVGTLEALAAGVPVVGFNHGGQPEIIDHGEDGWLAEPGDYDGLAEGIEWALSQKALITPKAQAKAAEYPWSRAADMYAEIYNGLAYERARPRPKVSVIVTAYNLEKYLPDTLRSVREQSLENFECIIVDDASPDSCGEIADVMAQHDERFRVIHNRENLYLAGARNVAIEEAKGEYIIPLDADDMLTPWTLKTLSEALDRDRSIDIAYGNVKFVDEDGKTPTDYGTVHGAGHSGWPVQFSFAGQARGLNYLPYCSMYRRRVWESIAGYRRRCRTAEDADFWIRAASYGFRPNMVISEDTLIYRNREGSMSRAEGAVQWIRWYPWGADPALAPAGAVSDAQLPIPSFDPPAVSVIIPVGPGHEEYVPTAVDSVDAQSFRGFECIVVNDTGKALPRLPSWVRVINTTGRTGPAASRNLGIKASRASYFLPLDADDILQPDALDWLLAAASMYPGEIIYCDFYDEKPGMTDRPEVYECPDYDPRLLIRRGTLHPVTALTPKEVWEAVGGYDPDMPCWEDWAFALGAIDKGYCSRRLRAPLFTYRKWTGTRREENQVDFDRCKEAIQQKFGFFWDGRRDIMACGCAAGSKQATVHPAQSSSLYATKGAPTGATLVRYTGMKQGEMNYRGKDTTYAFAANEAPKWVADEDVEMFRRRPDFEILDGVTTQGEEAPPPTLVAAGPPRGMTTHEPVEAMDPMNAGLSMEPAPHVAAGVAVMDRPVAEEAPDSVAFAPQQGGGDDGPSLYEMDRETAVRALMGLGMSQAEAEANFDQHNA